MWHSRMKTKFVNNSTPLRFFSLSLRKTNKVVCSQVGWLLPWYTILHLVENYFHNINIKMIYKTMNPMFYLQEVVETWVCCDEGRNETASYTKPNVNQCKLVCIFIESRKRKKISVAYFYGTRRNLLMSNLFRNTKGLTA